MVVRASLTLGFVMLALAADPTDVAVAGALCGAGHGYTFPILFGMVVTRARDAERGAAMSIFTALFDAGVLVGGPLFGWTYGQRLLLAIPSWGLFAELTHYALLYAVGALILAAGSVAYAILDRVIHNAHRITLKGESMRKKNPTTDLTQTINPENNPG